MVSHKKFDKVIYLGCSWKYVGKEERGIRLMSINKNIDDVIVSYSREDTILSPQANRRFESVKSTRLDGTRVL